MQKQKERHEFTQQTKIRPKTIAQRYINRRNKQKTETPVKGQLERKHRITHTRTHTK